MGEEGEGDSPGSHFHAETKLSRAVAGKWRERLRRTELEKLRALSSEQQSVIQTNMNKSPTNQTEAYMQHELTR